MAWSRVLSTQLKRTQLMTETMRVLVTGGAGFIGSHIVDKLVSDGCWVRIVDNLSTGKQENISGYLKHEGVDFVEGDLRRFGCRKMR